MRRLWVNREVIDAKAILSYVARVNRNLNLNLVNALRLRRAAVGF